MKILEKPKALDWLSPLRVMACVSIPFAEGLQMSLNGPFYPEEAINKGLDQTKIGLATGSQYLARLIGSIMVLMVVNARNHNLFFIAGGIGAGLTSIAFAYLVYIPGVWPFFILSTLGRFLIGIFSACVWGTGFSVITAFYPSSEGLIVGVMETAYGAGQMIGPVVGNVLFTWWGFPAPFNFAGICECMLSLICIFAIPGSIYPSRDRKVSTFTGEQPYEDIDARKSKTKVDWSVLLYVIKPEVIFASLPITTVYSTVGFVSVALGPYLLLYYGHDSTSNGRFFLSIFATATLFSLIFGFLIDKGYCGKIYLLSIFTGSIGYFMLFLPQFIESTRCVSGEFNYFKPESSKKYFENQNCSTDLEKLNFPT